MKNIFDEMTLNQLKLKNRLFRSATWVALADENGNLTGTLMDTYRELAKGGVGAIITGITTVSPHDAYLDGIVQFYDDKFIEQHKKFTDMIHEYDCKIFMQTAMVDSVFYIDDELYKIPIGKLTKKHISEFITLFRDSAIRTKSAGYDGIQLHVAHGFFLSKFICPLYNDRNDCISACKVMKAHDVDAIEISGNFTSREARAGANEGYFQKYAVAVKERVDIPIILVGGHRSIESMNTLINKTDIEYLSMSRALVREPGIINRWKSGDIRPSACIGCNACYRTPGHKCIFVLRGKA